VHKNPDEDFEQAKNLRSRTEKTFALLCPSADNFTEEFKRRVYRRAAVCFRSRRHQAKLSSETHTE